MPTELFPRFDGLVEKRGIEKLKTVGDACMVIAGAPNQRPDHLEALARLAFRMMDVARALTLSDGTPIEMRVGLDTGSAVAGIFGKTRSICDICGATVNMESRLESHGEAGRSRVTERVQQRLANTHPLTRRVETLVKNIGLVETVWLEGGPR